MPDDCIQNTEPQLKTNALTPHIFVIRFHPHKPILVPIHTYFEPSLRIIRSTIEFTPACSQASYATSRITVPPRKNKHFLLFCGLSQTVADTNGRMDLDCA